MIKTTTISLKSRNKAPDLINITDKIGDLVKESNIKDGQVLIFSRHTTAAVIIQESEKLLEQDIKNFLCSLAPKEALYNHSKSPDHLLDKKPNAHSHCQHLLLGPSEIIPISDGKLLLGTYQNIFFIELDHIRDRSLIVQISGEEYL